jgi:hypothetical protein
MIQRESDMAIQGTARNAGDGKELTPVQARQGFLDRPVLAVLIVSTALICAAFVFLYFYHLP